MITAEQLTNLQESLENALEEIDDLVTNTPEKVNAELANAIFGFTCCFDEFYGARIAELNELVYDKFKDVLSD